MIKAIISDFSRVLLFPKDNNYQGSLNELHRNKSSERNYNLHNYFTINDELLSFYKYLKDKVDLYIFTSETIQDSPELQPILTPVFKSIFSASKMGISKKDVSAYKILTTELYLNPQEILYIDDSIVNIEPADNAGLCTIRYKNNTDLIIHIQELLAK